MYRYRMIEEETGADLGPLVSSRDTYEPGEVLSRGAAESYVLVKVVQTENEGFRAYLIVRGR
jgi:hypothetical protein